MPQITTQEYCTRMGKEAKSGVFYRDCIAELFATFLFVVSVLTLFQQNQGQGQADPVVGLKLAIGSAFAWASIHYGLGDYGGAHMNNCITFACLIRREITLLRAMMYWVMQAAGSIAAAFFYIAITPTTRLNGWGLTVPEPDMLWWQSVLVEMWTTAIVCLAFLAQFNSDRKGYVVLPSLPVGFAIGIGTFAAYEMTRASMNSLRSLGPSVVFAVSAGNTDIFNSYWIYWAGPMLGGLVAGILFWIFDSVDNNKPQTPYLEQTGTWGDVFPQQRPQVMAPQSVMNVEPVLNVDAMTTVSLPRAIEGGFVQAYSLGSHTPVASNFYNCN